jgi:glutamine cyclotransferase
VALAALGAAFPSGACRPGQGAAGAEVATPAAARPAVTAEPGGAPGSSAAAAPHLAWRVVARYPHDPGAFTQGLLWHEGKLLESTGGYGSSDVRRVVLETGAVEASARLPAHHFGEGLALAGGRLVQLTWREGVAWLWDEATLAPLGERRYRGEGWGLTAVGDRLLQSDGSSRLTWRNAATLQPFGQVVVTDGGREVSHLNELETVGERVWANVWQTDEVVRLDPATGVVDARLDLAPLTAEAAAQAPGRIDVLNGIAWRAETGTLLVTGKLWPVLFELSIEER